MQKEGSNDWAEIGQSLKSVDDERIGSCKEDIDTLLVFVSSFVPFTARNKLNMGTYDDRPGCSQLCSQHS